MSYPAFIALVTALVACGAMSMDLYLPSFPGMAADLAASPAEIQLTMSVFLFGYAFSQLVCGPLSDRFGRQRVLLWGLSVYFIASLACALADSVELLIGLRLIQSFGACTGAVVGRALVRDRYRDAAAAKAFGYIGMAMMVTPILSPILGAWLEIGFGWRANFAFMTAYGAAVLAAVALLLRESGEVRDPTAIRPGRILANYLTLLRDRRHMGFTLTLTSAFAGVFAFVTGSSFVLIELLNVGPGVFAIMFAFTAGGYLAGSFIATRVVPRWGIDRTIVVGILLYLVFAVILNLLAVAGVFSVAAIIVPMTLISLGNGIVVPNAQAGAISPFPQMAGVAAAMVGFMAMGGAAIGGALVGVFYDGTQLPMTLTLLASAGALCLAYFGLAWRHRPSGGAQSW